MRARRRGNNDIKAVLHQTVAARADADAGGDGAEETGASRGRLLRQRPPLPVRGLGADKGLQSGHCGVLGRGAALPIDLLRQRRRLRQLSLQPLHLAAQLRNGAGRWVNE